MILLDLFSGMGGFHLGLEQSGLKFDKVYFSEIDKHAIANYKYNFPNAEYIGSVTDILDSGIERPNIVTFGSPCQDFSLAGKRKGLDGDRSSLIEYALSAVSHFRPDVFIWENVKGTFSSNGGRDFIAILQAIADIGLYECEWQLVNTSWLLPQNRERIYLVGHLATSFRNWKGVFPVGENGNSGNDLQGQSAIINTITARQNADGGGSSFVIESEHAQKDACIVSRGHGFVKDSVSDICPTIRRNSFEHNTAVIQVNESKESVGRQPFQHNRIYDDKGLCPVLNTDARSPGVFLSEPTHKHGEERFYSEVAPTVQARYGTGGDNIPYVNNIRRLTEIECERLQGFPDNWTQFGNYYETVKSIAKTQRYKLCGNAVTAKMVELIGSKIKLNY